MIFNPFKKGNSRISGISAAIILLVTMTALVACKGSHNSTSETAGDEIKMRHARLLTISETPDYAVVTVKNPWDTVKTLQRYVLVPKDEELPENLPSGTLIRTPVSNALVYSSVHAEIISELGAEKSIGGVCGAPFINNADLKKRISDGSITDCGNTQNPDIEKIIKMNPQIIMLSPFENNDRYAKVGTLGIPIVECADYMEKDPLGRAEWVRFYGLLFGCKDVSEEIFKTAETEYSRIRELAGRAETKPKVLLDQQYGQVWYVPGEASLMTRIIRDAGGINPFGEDFKLALAPEKVLAEAHDADVWIIRYNQPEEKTLTELAKDAPVNSHFEAFLNKNVYGCNTNNVRFFEETSFHPDRLLHDMVLMLHPGVLGADSVPYYYKKLQ